MAQIVGAFGVPHTPRQRDQQYLSEVRHFPAEDREVLPVDHEEADGSHGDEYVTLKIVLPEKPRATVCQRPVPSEAVFPLRRVVFWPDVLLR
jgi:hypothetical protein